MGADTFGADDLTALTRSIFREAFQAARMFPHLTWEQAYESFEEYSRQQEGKPFGTHTPEGEGRRSTEKPDPPQSILPPTPPH